MNQYQSDNADWLQDYNDFYRRAIAEEEKMGLTAKRIGGDDFPLPPEDLHLGICYLVVDLGIQETEYEGKTGHQHKVMVGWELSQALMEDGQPFVATKEYTLSLSEKSNLYKDLISWRGREFTPDELEGFDLFSILKAPAQISVVHRASKSGRINARVGAITKILKGTEVPELVNSLQSFSLEESQNPDEEIYEWIRKKISARVADNWDDFNGKVKPVDAPAPDFDDEIPF